MPSLTYAKYLDRVLGACLGAVAGATIGGSRDGEKSFATVKFDKKLLAKPVPNDVVHLAILNQHALRERGPHLTGKGLVDEWNQHCTLESVEYGIARRNWQLGVPPPFSGRHNNDFFGESVGAAARSFVWGLLSPGAPKTAVRYARRDAELDHHGDGVEAAQFAAAMMANVFVEADIETLIHTSLHQIEGATRFARMVRDVLRWTTEKEFEECVGLIRSRYATPDYSRALVNIGFSLAALVKNKGNFESSLLAIAGCGYNASRNSTWVGAVAGGLAGAEKLPDKWRKPLGEKLTLNETLKDFPTDGSFATLAEETCRLGMEIASVFETRVEFAQVPPKITVLDHNPMFLKVMDVFAEYPGAPTIRFGDDRDVRLKIVSRNPRRMGGVLRLETKSDLEIRPDAIPLDLGPYETRTIEIKLRIAAKALRLPITNLITTAFQIGKETIHRETFGIAASAQWLALGPFWENATAKDKHAAWSAQFTHNAGFHTKWLAEPDVDEKTKPRSGHYFDRVVIHADSDVIPVDNVFPPTGPATLYLAAKVYSPIERKAVIWLGSGGPVKLWVNKKCLIESDAQQFFTPFTHMAETKLSKGANRLLLKIARSDRQCAVRIGFREHGKSDLFSQPWITDLAFKRFEL